jgi:uncharacterized membrane protein YidH (DUF202 family)
MHVPHSDDSAVRTERDPVMTEFQDPPSRRTYYAEERTVLARWRTGMAAVAVALAVGGRGSRIVLDSLATASLLKLAAMALSPWFSLLLVVFGLGSRARLFTPEASPHCQWRSLQLPPATSRSL